LPLLLVILFAAQVYRKKKPQQDEKGCRGYGRLRVLRVHRPRREYSGGGAFFFCKRRTRDSYRV